MTIRHMRIFLEVCRTMNVTRAAENLYMTQPAVSRAIREIEQTYSIRLFERLNQRLYLTDSGRRMHAYAVHIVDTFDRMERELSDGDERGVLRVGAKHHARQLRTARRRPPHEKRTPRHPFTGDRRQRRYAQRHAAG